MNAVNPAERLDLANERSVERISMNVADGRQPVSGDCTMAYKVVGHAYDRRRIEPAAELCHDRTFRLETNGYGFGEERAQLVVVSTFVFVPHKIGSRQ